MTTTHAIDLLLKKLPPDTRLAHQLPGLTNNPLSIAVICNAGCKVFFHRTGCEVTLNGDLILQGWHDPKNQLWRVKIIDSRWTTKLTLPSNAAFPILALITPPTSIAQAMEISPPMVDHQANSLYECSNMHQLTHYCYACLKYPGISALTKDIDKVFLKGWHSLTSQVCSATSRCHLSPKRDTWIRSTKAFAPLNLPPQLPTPTTLHWLYHPIPRSIPMIT